MAEPALVNPPKGIQGAQEAASGVTEGQPRQTVRGSLYKLWYSQLSSYAHQRAGATMMAIFTNHPDLHDDPGMLESNVVSEALLFYTCVMSELEKAAGMPPSADLRAMWSQLWKLDDYSKRFAAIRYRRLLKLSPSPPS